MKLSILTNSNGVLNKTIDVDENGKLLKNHPDPMFSGTIQHRDISLSELRNGLSKLNGNHALVHGVVRGSEDKGKHIVVPVKEHNTNPENGKVSRSLDCIEYKGKHLAMLDHDTDEQCPHPYINTQALMAILSAEDMQWEEAEHCVVQSTSAGLYLDGEPLTVDDPGYHLYFCASKAERLKEYMTAMFKLTVIAGHGWVKLSSNGAMNIRSCFDGSVFSPERIDFTTTPTLNSDRLSQKRSAPEYFPGNAIDCSQIPEVDEAKYQLIVNALKNDPEIVKRSDELAYRKATAISKKRNISLEKARKFITSQIGGDLLPDEIINFQKFGGVSVADVLADLNKYDREPCADPGEPEYGTSKAILYANDGVKPIIHSVLHWGKNYFLPGSEGVPLTIEQLALLSPLEYDSLRKEVAKELGVRVFVLDDEVNKLRENEPAADTAFEEIKSWNDEVDGIELLNEIRTLIQNHLIVQMGVDIVISLWVLLTYCFDEFRILPLLGVTSPEKRCGKTTCAEVLHGLVNKPVVASNISSAVLYRIVEKYHPTMMVDEADTFLVDNDELRGVFNAGHTKKSAYVWRCNSETNEPEKFSVWGAKVILMIGDLPDTMKDRAIPVRMRRKAPGESVQKMTLDFDNNCQHLRRKCVRWCEDNHLKGIEPVIPIVGNDRASDNWLPILVIADKVGGDWPDLARAAMLSLETDEMNDKESVGQMLLEDIRKVFDKTSGEKISSENLVLHLVAMEERPWCEWRRGKPLTQNSLSKLLKPYAIKSKKIRFSDKTLMGFELEKFQDSFKRYLHPPIPLFQSGTPEQSNYISQLSGKQSGTRRVDVPLKKQDNMLKLNDCSSVPLQDPDMPQGYIKDENFDDWETI